ncbi:hypothetical protein FIBSPDRAFT_875593, partial [Athelia psychrophila]
NTTIHGISGLVPGAQRIIEAGAGASPLLLARDWRAFFDNYIIISANGLSAGLSISPRGVPISHTRLIVIGGTSATGGTLILGVARGSSASPAHYPHDATTTPSEQALSSRSAERPGSRRGRGRHRACAFLPLCRPGAGATCEL